MKLLSFAGLPGMKKLAEGLERDYPMPPRAYERGWSDLPPMSVQAIIRHPWCFRKLHRLRLSIRTAETAQSQGCS